MTPAENKDCSRDIGISRYGACQYIRGQCDPHRLICWNTQKSN